MSDANLRRLQREYEIGPSVHTRYLLNRERAQFGLPLEPPIPPILAVYQYGEGWQAQTTTMLGTNGNTYVISSATRSHDGWWGIAHGWWIINSPNSHIWDLGEHNTGPRPSRDAGFPSELLVANKATRLQVIQAHLMVVGEVEATRIAGLEPGNSYRSWLDPVTLRPGAHHGNCRRCGVGTDRVTEPGSNGMCYQCQYGSNA